MRRSPILQVLRDVAPSLLVLALVLPLDEALAQVTFSTNQAQFLTSHPDLLLQTFDAGNVSPGGISSCNTPVANASNDACFSPGDILPGIAFSTDPDFGETLLAGPSLFSNLNPNNVLLPDGSSQSSVITFPQNSVQIVGLELGCLFDQGFAMPCTDQGMRIDVFGAGDVLLGTTTVPVDSTFDSFVGISSDEPIDRISFIDDDLVTQLSFNAVERVYFPAASVPAMSLHSCESPRGVPVLHRIDPNTGATLTTTPIVFGEEVRGCNGLARDPTTGVCWIILTPPGSGGVGSEPGPRILATIDTETGIATEIGDTGQPIASITFDSLGALYALTGNEDGSATPTIYRLSKTDGSPTFFKALVGTEGGEALGFNPNDGLLYRTTGFTSLNSGQDFGSIDPDTGVYTQIMISGNTDDYGEQLALVHESGSLFLSAQRIAPALNSITTGGVVSVVGAMDHEAKGLAFDCGVARPITPMPTLSEWGVTIFAVVLGIVGILHARGPQAAHPKK